jgi:hypothetical protein
MNKETYTAFDPMDPLDAMILTDPEYDELVAEVESYVESCATGSSAINEFANDIVADDDEIEDFTEDEDDDSIDLAGDAAAEDAEDYSAAEMELLAGDFANNDAIDSLDDMEFTGEE